MARRTNIKGTANSGESGGTYLSQLERDDFKNWLLHRDVVRVDLQQPVIKVGRRRYCGDLLVHFRPETGRKRLVVEIKTSDEYADPEVRAHLDMKGALYKEAGYDCVVRTEANIYGEDFGVLDLLIWARAQPADQVVEDWIVEQVHGAGEISVGRLLAQLSDDRLVQLESIYKVWRVVALHRVDTLWRQPLNEQTVLRRRV